MRQVLFHIPLPWLADGIPIYGYGMMLFGAFILCNWLAGRRAQKEGIPRERIQDMAIWIFIVGLIGARTTYLLEVDHPASVVEFLKRFPRIWDGGIILYGAVLGGLAGYALAYWFILRKYQLSTWKIADIIAPAAAVGLCLGRIGCLLNGCCFGNVAFPEWTGLHFPLCAPPRVILVERGWQTAAGFTMTQQDDADLRTVRAVAGESPAAQAGLQPGDVIVAANGHPIANLLSVVYLDHQQRFLTHFDHYAAGRKFVDSLHQNHQEVVDVYDDLEDHLVHQWPRGQTEFTLTVQRDGGEITLPAIAPRTLGLIPTQVYESISMALLFLVLTAFYPLRRHDGEVMALLMLGYGAHRFLNERLRDDPRPVGFEEYISVFLMAAAVLIFLWLRRKPAQYGPPRKLKEPSAKNPAASVVG
ncbi:MAG: prolipoprotein diacylglyceryl transferase [Planctomycetes bacterium]|nr:prolipoprotein diacylglyceryl transferase [Planctomycetota bacterium]